MTSKEVVRRMHFNVYFRLNSLNAPKALSERENCNFITKTFNFPRLRSAVIPSDRLASPTKDWNVLTSLNKLWQRQVPLILSDDCADSPVPVLPLFLLNASKQCWLMDLMLSRYTLLRWKKTPLALCELEVVQIKISFRRRFSISPSTPWQTHWVVTN